MLSGDTARTGTDCRSRNERIIARRRNNYGEVWVVATSKDAKDKFGRPLVGKAYLVVTVPTYRRWDQAEITR